MRYSIPYWIKFGMIFTIIVVGLVILEMLTSSSLEFGTLGLLFTVYPVMFFLESIGLGESSWLIITATLIFIFIIGSFIGFLIQIIKTKSSDDI